MNAYIYCRAVSKAGLAAQKRACSAYCRKQNLTVTKTFTDRCHAGRAIRPGLSQLLRACGTGEARTVVVTSWDRLTRSFERHLEIVQQLRNSGVRLDAATPPVKGNELTF
jgi:DNA invertase Pin-like site-specific DNA recombinase